MFEIAELRQKSLWAAVHFLPEVSFAQVCGLANSFKAYRSADTVLAFFGSKAT